MTSYNISTSLCIYIIRNKLYYYRLTSLFFTRENDILVFILIQLFYSTMCLKTGKSSCLHYGILLPHINLYHRSKKTKQNFFFFNK